MTLVLLVTALGFTQVGGGHPSFICHPSCLSHLNCLSHLSCYAGLDVTLVLPPPVVTLVSPVSLLLVTLGLKQRRESVRSPSLSTVTLAARVTPARFPRARDPPGIGGG